MTHPLRSRLVAALWDTVREPQWLLLLISLALSLLAQLELQLVVTLLGGLVAAALCFVALRAFGVSDAEDVLDFLNPFGKAPALRDTAVAALALGSAVAVFWSASNASRGATAIREWLPRWFAPSPNTELITVTMIIAAITVFATATLALQVRRRTRIEADPASISRRFRRETLKKSQQKDHLKELRNSRRAVTYWTEAVVTLVCAFVALLPGAFGWPLLLSLSLSVILPLFILSARHRFAIGRPAAASDSR